MTEVPETIDDFLMHYGVKGMKWGVRKSRAGSHHPTGTSSAKSGGGQKKVAIQKNATGLQTKVSKLPNGKSLYEVTHPKLGKKTYMVDRDTAAARAKAESMAEKSFKGDGKKVQKAVNQNAPDERKPVKKLSDEELKRTIERIELERRYSQLTAKPTKQKSRAEKMIEEALYGAGEQAIKNVVAKHSTKLLDYAAGKAINQVQKALGDSPMGKKSKKKNEKAEKAETE